MEEPVTGEHETDFRCTFPYGTLGHGMIHRHTCPWVARGGMMKRLILAAVLCVAAPVSAQTFPIKMIGQHSAHFKGKSKVAIGSYGINYVVAQKGTAVAGVGLASKVVTGLTGVDEATMRALANEGHADLKAQLTAAGIPIASESAVRGALSEAGVALLPGNSENYRDGGITIGKSVKKASVAYGADAAPLTDMYPASGKLALGFGAIGKVQKLGKPGAEIDAVIIFPVLTLDYADTEVKVSRTLTGAKRGTVKSNVAFGIRTQSTVNVVNPAYTAGMFYPAKDVFIEDDFTASPQTITAMANDSAYLLNIVDEQKKGNVVVDLPKWKELVRAAYRAYNAAIVEAISGVKTG